MMKKELQHQFYHNIIELRWVSKVQDHVGNAYEVR